jgi:hypothetical protein
MSNAAEPPAVRMTSEPAKRPSRSQAIASAFKRSISAVTVSASCVVSPLICKPS